MSFNGSGTFNINSTGQPVVTGTVISSSVFNALTADLATGLSTCITKDGQTTVTANIPMNSFKFTNLAAGTAAGDSVRVSQLQAGSATVITVTGTDTYTGTMSPALAAYAAGNMFTFVVPNTNTTACTINIDGLGAKSITRDGSTALVAGDLVANSEVTVIYDGTRFQVLNSNSKTNWTVSNALTLSAGTANGVAYLNGSKALTTGSALVFDGTNFSTTGTATATKLVPTGNVTAGNGMYLPAANEVAWSVNGSEGMRLTSTGLGIGTSSPDQKVHAYNTASNTWFRAQSGGDNSVGLYMTNSQRSWLWGVSGGGAGSIYLYDLTGSKQVLNIDSSGNLGLGVTPSAWGTAWKAFDISATGAFGATSGGTYSIYNAYYNSSGNPIYKTTQAAFMAGAEYNRFVWYTAPSGTAGNAISFTQAMTLDASGYLLVGATSTAGVGASRLQVGSTSSATSHILLQGTSTHLGLYAAAAAEAYLSYAVGSALIFGNGPANGSTFTERARIDSSGNLLVGTTSIGYTSSNSTYYTPTAAYWINNHATGTASGTRYIGFGIGVNEIGSITQNGTTGVLYNITSDYRLKEFVAPVTDAGQRIDALNPVEFDWKSDGSRARGFFAHEFQQVYPDSVTGEKDAVDEDGNPVYQTMQASTAEVIADLVAEIKSLRQRVAQLEVK